MTTTRRKHTARADRRHWTAAAWAAGISISLALVRLAYAQGFPAFPPDPAEAVETELRLTLNQAPVELVLDAYGEQTGRTLLLGPSLPSASITLRSQGSLTREEYLGAIETVLGMHGIALLPEGEKFLRVVPNKQAREEPMPILTPADAEGMDDSGRLISQMIPLTHIEAAEAQKAITPLKHGYAQIHVFDTINSILLTDTAANVNRVLQVIEYIDQPIEAREEPIVIQIRYAKAADIKAKLEQIVKETQGEEQKSTVQRQRESGAPGVDTTPRAGVPGVIRARRQNEPESIEQIIEQAERGIIRGDVRIIEDDRTNILIIITRPENMRFFEKIIKVLDVETAPDVMVKVFRLEYAEAKDIASMLNDLIGAASDEDGAPAAGGEGAERGEGAALREYVERRETARAVAARKSKVGELSKDDIKILSDERTNALIIMASKADLAALEEIISDMDLMLSQVLVEAVILEISLDDSLETAVDWLQRALLTYEERDDGTRQPKVAWAGGGGGGGLSVLDPLTLTSPALFPKGDSGQLAGLSYYLTLFDLNMDVVLRAVATDSRTRILSSPVILTTDNKVASIDVATDRYFFKGKKYVGGSGEAALYEDDVERQKVGIKLMVTPRINEKKFVVMEIEQNIENVSGTQTIEGNDWPIVTSRKLEADIAVRSGETIVLGGLVVNEDSRSKSKVPILGDIPILGLPFRSSSKGKVRNEVIVFITPYVMDTPEEIMRDAVRRQDAMALEDMWQRGWSDSRLAEPRRLEAIETDSVEDAMTAPNDAMDMPVPGRRGASPMGLSPMGASPLGAMPDGGGAEAPANADAGEGAEPELMGPPAGPETGASGTGEEWDPLNSLDSELRDYIQRQDKRWRRSLRKVDQTVDRQRTEEGT